MDKHAASGKVAEARILPPFFARFFFFNSSRTGRAKGNGAPRCSVHILLQKTP